MEERDARLDARVGGRGEGELYRLGQLLSCVRTAAMYDQISWRCESRWGLSAGLVSLWACLGVGECARLRGTSGRVAPQEEPREGPRGLCHGLTVHPSAPAPRGEELQLPRALSALGPPPGPNQEPGRESGRPPRARSVLLVSSCSRYHQGLVSASLFGQPDSPMTPIDRDEKQNETKNKNSQRPQQ